MTEMAPAIIIVGVARGGTSMVAGICAHLGIPMGKRPPRYENPYLQWAVMHDRWDVVEQLIRTIELDDAIWGWKLPLLVDHLPKVAALVPQARFIFVTKEVTSGARRRAEAPDSKRFAKLVRRTAQRYVTIARFAEHTPHPTLFVSYEEAMRDLSGTIEAIAAYCGPPKPDTRPIIDAVRSDHASYRASTYFPRGETSESEARLVSICKRNGISGPPVAAGEAALTAI